MKRIQIPSAGLAAVITIVIGMPAAVDAETGRSAIDDALAKVNAGCPAEYPENAEIIAEGAGFHRIAQEIRFVGPKGFQAVSAPGALDHHRSRGTMKNLSERGKGGYRELAKAHLASLPAGRPVPEQSLVAGPKEGDAAWVSKANGRLERRFEIKDPGAIKGLALDYDCGSALKVFLNDTLIMHLDPPGGTNKYGKALIPLKPSTRMLLKRGANHLALEIGGAKKDGVQVELKAAVD